MSKSYFSKHTSFYTFSKEIKENYRFVESVEKTEFIKAFKKIIIKYETEIKKDTLFVRAQRGTDYSEQEDLEGNQIGEFPCPYGKERMVPKKEYSKNGRINPIGILYLYLSNNINTALAECRPWIGETLTLAEFKIQRNLKIVGFGDTIKNYIFMEPPNHDKYDEIVWNDINRAFAVPVNGDESDYLITQVLSEIIKAQGYDGLAYKSLLGPGFNIALFDIKDAIPIKGSLFDATKIEYTFSKSSDTMFYQ